MLTDVEALTQDLKSMIAKVVEKEPSVITEDALFQNLGADSMMMLEIMVAVERKYKVEIPETLLSKMINLKETINIIKALTPKS